MVGPSGGGKLSLGSGELGGSLFSGPQNAGNDVGDGATSVGTQNLDSDEIDGLGNTVLARTGGTSAMGSVTVAVLVDVVLGDSCAPSGATLELDVVNVDTGINDVHIDTLTASRIIIVDRVCVGAELLTVRGTRKTLRDGISRQSRDECGETYPWSRVLSLVSVNNRILFNVRDLWRLPDSLDDAVGETASVTREIAVVHMADPNGPVSDKKIFLMSGLEEVEVIVHRGCGEFVLQHDDVGVVDHLVLVLNAEGVEGGEHRRRPLTGNVMRGGYGGGDKDGEIEGG